METLQAHETAATAGRSSGPQVLMRHSYTALLAAGLAMLPVSASTSLPERLAPTVLSALSWRNIGPPKGGRSIAVAGNRERAILPSDGPVRTVAFSPDRSLVVTASRDGTARVWRTDGTLVWTLAHRGPVTAPCSAPMGRSQPLRATTTQPASRTQPARLS
jgi:WD40 repeat protein